MLCFVFSSILNEDFTSFQLDLIYRVIAQAIKKYSFTFMTLCDGEIFIIKNIKIIYFTSYSFLSVDFSNCFFIIKENGRRRSEYFREEFN